MPYDLYGNHYASRRDAENAEMAQCAQISCDLADQRINELERKLYEAQQPSQHEESLNELWQYVRMLEDRIRVLEGDLR